MANKGQNSSKKAHLPVAVRYNPDARVRTTTYRKKPLYTILYGYDANDKQQVVSRRDKADATDIAKKAVLAARAQSEGRDAASVTISKEAFDYAASELAPYNVDIVEVVAWWKKWHDSIKHYVSVTEAVDLWVEEHHFKTGKTNKSEAYWQGMKDTYLGPFKKTFPDRQITTLTKEDFVHYLFEVKTGVSHAQKKEHTNKLRTWLGWCITKGFFSNQTKPLDGIKYGKDAPKKGADERIVSVEVLRSALDFCALGQTPRDLNIGIILAIRVFVGFRARETYTLRFRAIKDRNKGIIRITPNDEPKTFARNPDLQPATIEWLNHFMDRFPKGQKPKDDDWLMPKTDTHQKIAKERITTGGWRQHLGHSKKSSWGSRWEAWAKANNRPFQRLEQNRVRDTFASCALIVIGQDKTLYGMGENNPATLKKWYYNAIDSDGAKAHFEFRPGDEERLLAAFAKQKAQDQRDIQDFTAWEEANEALVKKFGKNPLQLKGNKRVSGYYDEFKVDGEAYEMCDFFPNDYRPQKLFEHIPGCDYMSAPMDEIEAHEKLVSEIPKNQLKILKRQTEWCERMKEQGRDDIANQNPPRLDHDAVRNGFKLLGWGHQADPHPSKKGKSKD